MLATEWQEWMNAISSTCSAMRGRTSETHEPDWPYCCTEVSATPISLIRLLMVSIEPCTVSFFKSISSEGFDFFSPPGYDKIYREGKKVLMNILDIEVPLIAAVNGPVRLHSEYILLADIVLATPSTVFQDKPHFDFGIVPGDGVNLLWPEVIGSVRGRYFILTQQELGSETAKEWGVVNEIVPADKLRARAADIAERLAKLPPLTTRYTRIALTQKLRRIVDEGIGYGLALEGISAADVARANTPEV